MTDLREQVITDEMVERALNAEYGNTTLHDLGDPYFKSIHKDIVRAALKAVLPLFDAERERLEENRPRKLSQVEYGWVAFNPDGSATRGDLYVCADGVVRFLADGEKP